MWDLRNVSGGVDQLSFDAPFWSRRRNRVVLGMVIHRIFNFMFPVFGVVSGVSGVLTQYCVFIHASLSLFSFLHSDDF